MKDNDWRRDHHDPDRASNGCSRTIESFASVARTPDPRELFPHNGLDTATHYKCHRMDAVVCRPPGALDIRGGREMFPGLHPPSASKSLLVQTEGVRSTPAPGVPEFELAALMTRAGRPRKRLRTGRCSYRMKSRAPPILDLQKVAPTLY